MYFCDLNLVENIYCILFVLKLHGLVHLMHIYSTKIIIVIDCIGVTGAPGAPSQPPTAQPTSVPGHAPTAMPTPPTESATAEPIHEIIQGTQDTGNENDDSDETQYTVQKSQHCNKRIRVTLVL